MSTLNLILMGNKIKSNIYNHFSTISFLKSIYISLFIHTRHLLLTFLLLSTYTVAESATSDQAITKQTFDCVLVPSNVADLGSNARGVINSIVVDRNDLVKDDDVIAILDDTVEQATVELAMKQASTLSEIELRKVNIAYAKREQKRLNKAFQGKACSQHDFDIAKVETELAKIKLLQAQEQQILAKNELKRAKAKLAHRTIRAPFAGIVTERFKTIGEYIDDDAVIRLAQIDPLHVEVIVPVMELGKIKIDMPAKVCTDKNGGKGWDATVSQVDQVIDAASGTFGVRLILKNTDYKIPAGLRCDLKFITSETQETSTQSVKAKQ